MLFYAPDALIKMVNLMSTLIVDTLKSTDGNHSVNVSDLIDLDNFSSLITAENITAKSALSSSSVLRTVLDRLDDHISVKDFGAKGDGITDDTSFIQAAIDYAKSEYESTGRKVGIWLPSGIYITEKITIYAHSHFFGSGRSSVLKRKDSYFGDIIYGVNSDSLWGYTGVNASEFAYNFDLHDLVVDGSIDGVTTPFSSSITGHGIAIWGARYRMYNIDIINCAEYGVRTEYKDQNLDYLAPWFESSIYSIRINNTGKTGWECNGPHDAAIHDIGIINGSRLGNGLYDGFHAGTQMSGNIGNLHVSNAEDNTGTGSTIRHRYAGNIEGPCRFYGGTTFEGAISCVRIASSSVQFDDSCTFYIPWGDGSNGTVMWIEAGVAFCIIRGKFGGAGSLRTQINWGIRFRIGTGNVSHNDIEVVMEGIQIPLSFGTSTSAADADGGKNKINILAYYSDTSGGNYPSTYGIPNTANGTELDLIFSGNTNQRIRSTIQNKIVTLAAGATYTWTYKYPFNETPALSLSIVGISGTPTGQLYAPGVTNTQATIFNNTGQSLTMHATVNQKVSE